MRLYMHALMPGISPNLHHNTDTDLAQTKAGYDLFFWKSLLSSDIHPMLSQKGVLTSNGHSMFCDIAFPMPAGIFPVLSRGSSQLLPSCCSCWQPRGHTLPQLDLGLMAAHTSAGCCLVVRFCTFSECSLNFCSLQQNVKENTFVLLACRLASTVQWKESVVDSPVNPGYKGKMT